MHVSLKRSLYLHVVACCLLFHLFDIIVVVFVVVGGSGACVDLFFFSGDARAFK